MNNNFDFTDDEFYEKFNKSIKYITLNKIPSNNSSAWILGGQPGCGKTKLQDLLIEEQNSNFIIINGDIFRDNHPHFEKIYAENTDNWVTETGSFSNRMTFLFEGSFLFNGIN